MTAARFWRKARAFGVMMLMNSSWTMPMCPEYADYLHHIMANFWGGPDPYDQAPQPSESDIQREIDADLDALFHR